MEGRPMVMMKHVEKASRLLMEELFSYHVEVIRRNKVNLVEVRWRKVEGKRRSCDRKTNGYWKVWPWMDERQKTN